MQRVLIDSNKAKQPHQHAQSDNSPINIETDIVLVAVKPVTNKQTILMQSSQICKLTQIYCFSPNMLDIG